MQRRELLRQKLLTRIYLFVKEVVSILQFVIERFGVYVDKTVVSRQLRRHVRPNMPVYRTELILNIADSVDKTPVLYIVFSRILVQ